MYVSRYSFHSKQLVIVEWKKSKVVTAWCFPSSHSKMSSLEFFVANNLQKFLWWTIFLYIGLPREFSDKETACQYRRCEFDPWVGATLWRRKWQPRAVFLPGESHGQRNLAGTSWGAGSWGCKELDSTERPSPLAHTYWYFCITWKCLLISCLGRRSRMHVYFLTNILKSSHFSLLLLLLSINQSHFITQRTSSCLPS